jgi:hypothetical protein
VKLKPTANGIAPVLVREGLLPCGPWEPTVAITVRVLEAYRIQHARCPQLAIQSFVKSLSDMHGVGGCLFSWFAAADCPSRSRTTHICASNFL